MKINYTDIELSDDLSLVIPKSDGERKYVRVFGSVSAGFPSPAEDFTSERLSLDQKYLSKPESTFIISVGGYSMSPEYLIGDELICRSDLEPRQNDDIVVSVNSSAYSIKRYDKVNKRLIAINPEYAETIHFDPEDEVVILGVVTTMFRNIRH